MELVPCCSSHAYEKSIAIQLSMILVAFPNIIGSIRVLVELKHLPLPFAFPLAALTSTGALHARRSLSIGRLQQFKFCRRCSQFISLQAVCIFQVRVSHNFDATR